MFLLAACACQQHVGTTADRCSSLNLKRHSSLKHFVSNSGEMPLTLDQSFVETAAVKSNKLADLPPDVTLPIVVSQQSASKKMIWVCAKS